MSRFKKIGLLVVAALVATTGTVIAITDTFTMQPGNYLEVNCSTKLVLREQTDKTMLLRCRPLYLMSPSPTAPPTVAPTPEPTVVPTPPPSVEPTPVPPTPTATPTTPPSSGEIVGYGATATGGTTRVEVDTLAEFKAALRSGNYVKIVGSGVWNNAGGSISVPSNVTIDGEGSTVQFRNAWLRVLGSNVIVRHIRMRTGDENTSDAADAINLQGSTAGISRIVLDHVEAIWAQDVAGVTILNRVTDVTIQYSIIGVGLTKSSHPESTEDIDGHNLAFNIAGQEAGAVPERITIYRNLILHAQGRNPQVQGAKAVDLINNVIYNYDEAPLGNPQGLNVVNNLYRWGPGPSLAGLGDPDRFFWKFRGSSDHPNAYSSSVYLSGNVADGFTSVAPEAPSSTLRSTPASPLSVTPLPVSGLLDLSGIGPKPSDTTTLRWVSDTLDRVGRYFNGAGFPAPNPSW